MAIESWKQRERYVEDGIKLCGVGGGGDELSIWAPTASTMFFCCRGGFPKFIPGTIFVFQGGIECYILIHYAIPDVICISIREPLAS